MAQKTTDWTVLSMLNWGTDYFDSKGIKNPRLSIEWLLAFVLDVKRLDLYLSFDRPISPGELETLRPIIKRRADHEPLQYIVGETEFLNAIISVDKNVLIPRPETEQLVELVLNEYDEHTIHSVLDIGTGSGCIPVALKMERPLWNVNAMDISKEAIGLARQNAIRNQVEIRFKELDLFQISTQDLDDSYEVIVSNPPYVLQEEKEVLDREVVEFEPHLALFCKDTENMYSAIEKIARTHLSKSGTLFLEIHHSQAKIIRKVFGESRWAVEVKSDYDGHDRFVLCKPLQL